VHAMPYKVTSSRLRVEERNTLSFTLLMKKNVTQLAKPALPRDLAAGFSPTARLERHYQPLGSSQAPCSLAGVLDRASYPAFLADPLRPVVATEESGRAITRNAWAEMARLIYRFFVAPANI
jgi:hypothetical protein